MGLHFTDRGQKTYSVKRILFTSYWLMVLCMVVVILIYAVFSFQNAHEAMSDTQSSQLRILKYQMDSVFSEIEIVMNSLNTVQTQNVAQMECEDVYSPWQLEDIVDFQKDMSQILSGSPYMDQIYMMNFKADTVIADRIYHPRDRELFFQRLGMDEEDARMFMENINQSQYYIVSDGTDIKSLLYLEKIFIDSYKAPDSVLIAVIPYERIRNILSNYTTEDRCGAELVWDGMENVASDLLPEGDALKTQTSGRIYKTLSDGQSLIYSFESSDHAPVRFYYFTPFEMYYAGVIQLIWAAVLDLLAALIISAGLALYIRRKNFTPLKRIMTILGNEDNNFSYHALEEEITQGIRRQKALESEVQRSKPAQIQGFILKVMEHRERNQDRILKFMEKYQLQVGQRLVVAGILLKDDFEQDDKERELMCFAICNILTENLSKDYQVWVISDYDKVIALFDLAEKDSLELLYQACLKSMEIVSAWFGIHTVCVFSEECESFMDIDKGYLQMMGMSEYCDILGIETGILTYKSLVRDESTDSQTYFLKMNKYMNMILAKDYEGAYALFQDIYAHELPGDFQSISQSRMRMLHLLSMIIVPYRDMGGKLEMKDIESKRSLEELFNEGKEIFSRLMPRTATDGSLIDIVRQYIQEHALEDNINVASISDAVGVTASYLSRIFKKEVGIGVLDYLHRVRMVHAKELLKSGATVADTAVHTGYLDSKAFIRAFKRYEGITPGQYKNIEGTGASQK